MSPHHPKAVETSRGIIMTNRERALVDSIPTNAPLPEKHELYPGPRSRYLSGRFNRYIQWVDADPNGGVVSEYARRTLNNWGVQVDKLGSGAYGYVAKFPGHLAKNMRANPAKYGIRDGVFRSGKPIPNGPVAVKLQLIATPADLRDAVDESIKHNILQKPDRSRTRSNIPSSSKYVPTFYWSGYYPAEQMYVTFMQLLNGKQVEDFLEDGGVVTPSLAVEFEKALASMWKRGFAHADAHDKNLWVVGLNRVMIADFGMSVTLPPSLRPTSMQAARNPAYLDKLQAYMIRRWSDQKGDFWVNPNTRFLKWIRSKVPDDRYHRFGAIRTAANSRVTNNPYGVRFGSARVVGIGGTDSRKSRKRKRNNGPTTPGPWAGRLRPRKR